MSRLTVLELSIRHGACARAGCAICNERPVPEVASYLERIGFNVLNYTDETKTSFGSVEVAEDEATCSILLKID